MDTCAQQKTDSKPSPNSRQVATVTTDAKSKIDPSKYINSKTSLQMPSQLIVPN